MSKINYNQIIEYILENQEKFYRLAYSYTKDQESALDAVQSAICKALEKHRTLKNSKAVKTWFYRILVNECLMNLRMKEKETLVSPEQWIVGSYIEPAFEENVDLYEKLALLPAQTRTIIILHFFEEMTLREISEITGINLNTVKSKLYSGLRKLKVAIKKEASS